MHSKQSQTDWTRVGGLHDDDIDLSDNPEVSTEMFARAVVRQGLQPVSPKDQVLDQALAAGPEVAEDEAAADIEDALRAVRATA